METFVSLPFSLQNGNFGSSTTFRGVDPTTYYVDQSRALHKSFSGEKSLNSWHGN